MTSSSSWLANLLILLGELSSCDFLEEPFSSVLPDKDRLTLISLLATFSSVWALRHFMISSVFPLSDACSNYSMSTVNLMASLDGLVLR